jgi:hypothetical protein
MALFIFALADDLGPLLGTDRMTPGRLVQGVIAPSRSGP